MALLSLENGNHRQAEHLLKQAEKKASPLIARRSMEKLSQLGNVQEHINRSYSLYKKFPDEETKLAAAKEFFKNKEYARVICLTEKIDLKNCLNETVYYRLSSMQKKNDSRFSKEFFEWCVSRAFSDFHYKLFCEIFKSEEAEESNVIQLRADVFTKNYVAAYSNAKLILENKKFLLPQILSDAGKAFLYGSNNFFSNALYLDSIKKNLPDDCKFYADFYSGRLYDKSDSYKTRALNRFVFAMQESLSDANFDNALWYYLNCLLKISVPKTIDAITQ